VKDNRNSRFARLQKRIGKLRSFPDCGRRRKPGIIERAIEELQAALGELQVIEEELRFQHDELLVARKDSDNQRRRYKQLFDFIPDACLITDKAGKIREANLAAAAVLGIDREALSGRPIVDLVIEDRRDEFQGRLARMTELERIEDWPLRFRRGDGEEWLDARVTVEVFRAANDTIMGLQWIIKEPLPK
jgi:PAS domain S-box-containing protein